MIKTKTDVTLTPKQAAAQMVWASLPKSETFTNDTRPLANQADLDADDFTEREEKLIFAQYEKFLARIKKMLKVE